ncbi:MAG: hypothetical protein HYR56_06580 [Acidobacteria bacterium]|nr:hypothetical protein [Acidobacteriota bacterium]MBI3426607.1 hypothetical protein [Acidobacteriota bacterium]
MFTRRPFHQRHFIIARFIALCAVLLITVLAVFNTGAPRGHAGGKRQSLTFEDRVAAQRAIEAVYHRQRLWPTDNPQPKPALDEVLPAAALRAQVEEYLRMSRALEVFTGAALTPEQLQAELERMARQTRQPAVLGALWAALEHEPLLLAECLARPVLAERELRLRLAECGRRIGGCEAFGLTAAANPPSAIHHPQFEEWWRGVRGALDVAVDAPGWAYRLPEIAAVAVPCGSDGWTATSTTGAPSVRTGHTAVWTGSEMIIWGGGTSSGVLNTGGRYFPATDAWMPTNTVAAPSTPSSCK